VYERFKEVCRRKGLREGSLFSFYYAPSEVRGIKETHNCSYAIWGVISPKAPLRGIFHSSPVLTVELKTVFLCMVCISIRY